MAILGRGGFVRVIRIRTGGAFQNPTETTRGLPLESEIQGVCALTGGVRTSVWCDGSFLSWGGKLKKDEGLKGTYQLLRRVGRGSF